MIDIENILKRVDIPTVLQSLVEGWAPGVNVSCPMAATKHENGTDNSKGMSISVDGKVFCHACGYKATSVINLYNDIFGYEFVEGCKAFYAEYVEPLVPDEYYQSAHEELLKKPLILARLDGIRGIKQSVVKHYKLGWKGNRLIIPIFNELGFCVNVRKYDLLKTSNIKLLSYDKGFGKARLYPLSSLQHKKVYLFEGETDTLCALQAGINGITVTTGAGVWTEEFSKAFLDKDVIIVPDTDEAGQKGLQLRGKALQQFASSVSYISLPVPKGKKDFTDFFIDNAKGSIVKFLALPIKAFTTTIDKKVIPSTVPLALENVLCFAAQGTEAVNMERANTLLDYLKGNGAFFKNILGVLFYARKKDTLLRVSVQDSQFLGFLSRLSPLLNTATSSGKFVMQHIINSAQALCTFSKSAFWSVLNGHDLYLSGTEGNIMHFKDGKYTLLPNAVNKENVLLELPQHTIPFHVVQNVHGAGVQMLWDKVFSNIAVSDENRYLLMCWMLGIFFRVEVRNKPLMRLSASTAYGKSTASKLLSILLYGDEMLHHSASTMASMYSLASEYPLLIFDNLETRNMVPALEDFLIVAATGGMKSKRVMDTTSAVAFERIDSLVLTNGIEPFSKHEILNRTIELPLNIDRYGKTHFHELKIIEDLKACRNSIIFSVVGLLSKRVIPRFMSNEVQRIAKHFGPHSKERFNEYFGLMAIILDAIWPYMPAKGYALPHDLVNQWIGAQNVEAKASDEGTNDVLYFLDTFAKRRHNLLDADTLVEHKSGQTIMRCTTRDLLSDFRLLSKHLSIKCPWNNEKQLGVRLADASEILHKAGWEHAKKLNNGRKIHVFSKKGFSAKKD